MADDRMFRVIVVGGIALVACGGSVTTATPVDAGDAAATADAFPFEGPPFYPSDAGVSADAFPFEGPPPPVDSGARDAGVDAFPTEGPPPPPQDAATTSDGAAGADASFDGGFPVEAP